MNTRVTESDCPRCDGVLELNEKEGCYECLKCGYIDCGDEKLTNKINEPVQAFDFIIK